MTGQQNGTRSELCSTTTTDKLYFLHPQTNSHMELRGSSHVNLHLNAILPWGKEWDNAYVFLFLTDGLTKPVSNWTVSSRCGVEVCGRDADDAHLIQVSINAPPSVVVVSFPNGQLFSLGSRVCISILNPAVLAPHKLSPPLSHVSSSCSHASILTNLGPVARLDCGEGQTRAHACPKYWNPWSFRFWSRPHHDVHEVICG